MRGITVKVRVKDGFLEEITVNLKGKDQIMEWGGKKSLQGAGTVCEKQVPGFFKELEI